MSGLPCNQISTRAVWLKCVKNNYTITSGSHFTCRAVKTEVLGLTVLGSGFLLFLNVTYEAMEEDSGTGDLVLGGTMPTG